MPDMLYVGMQDDNRIAVFAVDGDSGRLTRRADVAAAGGPSVTAISPDRNTLYVRCRAQPSIASYRIDPRPATCHCWGPQRRRLHQPFWRPIAPAAICFAPTTRGATPRC